MPSLNVAAGVFSHSAAAEIDTERVVASFQMVAGCIKKARLDWDSGHEWEQKQRTMVEMRFNRPLRPVEEAFFMPEQWSADKLWCYDSAW